MSTEDTAAAHPSVSIQAIGGRVTGRRVDADRSRGGIILPGGRKLENYELEVLTVGDGYLQGGQVWPLVIKVGDRIIAGEAMCVPMSVDGEEYYSVREIDVLGVVKRTGGGLEGRQPGVIAEIPVRENGAGLVAIDY